MQSKQEEELHAVVRGSVQGVGFRVTVQRLALQLGLTGTVRNLADGSVEINAQGRREILEVLIEQVKEKPGLGHIESVQVVYRSPTVKYDTFRITF